MHLRSTLAAAVALIGLASCQKSLPDLPQMQLPIPDPADVESVVFLIGDAGYADENRDPILHALRGDVEYWAGQLARDSAVQVLFLGDIVYPAGLRTADPADFAKDSAHVQSQVNIVAGPNARRFSAIGYFMAGNHDWGNAREHTGVRRLQNLEQFLDRRREGGVHVRLEPKAGEPGPAVIDYRGTRLLIIDSAWWLLADDAAWKRRSYLEMRAALETAGRRNVIVAAHHPFFSGGSHGGLVPFWRALGIRFLLSRSGALLQDLNSLAYRDLLGMLANAFEVHRPLLFAGGHDHSLQIIESTKPRTPLFTAVIGSASKISRVGAFTGMTYRRSAPGYARVMTRRDGRVEIFVIAAPDEDYLSCEGADAAALAQCMRERAAAFTITHAQRLK